ncbi:MAG TPA: carbon starvation CstA family protein, partial [Vicinamibacterales bacterium]|nr:carbon starvation CstA family protein [Vicinamibacterales bacterium]
MTLFFAAVALLVAGYFTYGAIVDRVFGPDLGRTAPAVAQADGIDFVAMSWPRVFLIQLLNIAGVGPIFGALAGALWGPVAFLWIVFGSILAGGVHDYLSGLLSMRNRGGSISEIVGFYLGPAMKDFARVFSVVLLVL